MSHVCALTVTCHREYREQKRRRDTALGSWCRSVNSFCTANDWHLESPDELNLASSRAEMQPDCIRRETLGYLTRNAAVMSFSWLTRFVIDEIVHQSEQSGSYRAGFKYAGATVIYGVLEALIGRFTVVLSKYVFAFAVCVGDQELMCKMPADTQLFITQLWTDTGMGYILYVYIWKKKRNQKGRTIPHHWSRLPDFESRARAACFRRFAHISELFSIREFLPDEAKWNACKTEANSIRLKPGSRLQQAYTPRKPKTTTMPYYFLNGVSLCWHLHVSEIDLHPSNVSSNAHLQRRGQITAPIRGFHQCRRRQGLLAASFGCLGGGCGNCAINSQPRPVGAESESCG